MSVWRCAERAISLDGGASRLWLQPSHVLVPTSFITPLPTTTSSTASRGTVLAETSIIVVEQPESGVVIVFDPRLQYASRSPAGESGSASDEFELCPGRPAGDEGCVTFKFKFAEGTEL